MGGVSRGGQVGDTVSLVSTNDGDKGRERWGCLTWWLGWGYGEFS